MDLDIVRVIKSIPKEHEREEMAPLITEFGERLAHDDVCWVHPRPRLERAAWKPLDGWWECAFVKAEHAAAAWKTAEPPAAIDTPIRVPFSPEAALSGVGRQLQPDELLWYRCMFTPPEPYDGGSCILTFDGVDHACSVYVNGRKVAEHEGAYLPFSIDITDDLREGDEENELCLCVYDPSETGMQLRGKQKLERGGMWYTAQSGIWQSVWLESRPHTCIEELQVEPNPQTGEVSVNVRSSGVAMLEVELCDPEGASVTIVRQSRRVHGLMTVTCVVPEHRLWSPQDPALYRLQVTYGEDVVKSFFGFRAVSVEPDDHGDLRICVNHQPIFLRGLLDQGYWPEGLMTPPCHEAMRADIEAAKTLGFNMVRKHIKVESERFYALCDECGLLVLQDMPSGGAVPSDHWSRNLPTLYRRSWHGQRDDTPKGHRRLGSQDAAYRSEWTRTCTDAISRLRDYCCVIGWVLFNESWGQFDAAKATQLAYELDPSRPVLSSSGWYDQGVGDIRGVHNYFRGIHVFADPYAKRGEPPRRVQLYSEFGGLTWSVAGHSALPHSYGYAEFETFDDWKRALQELLAQADAMEADGLAGFVYTELTDIEEETNGLLTYDRRVNKLEG